MSDNPHDPNTDPFKPPAIPTIVSCLHCGEEFDSYLIEWRIETDADGSSMGFWCCPTPGCDGKGFGFDIFPLDPEYRDENGNRLWCGDDGEDALGEDDADGLASEEDGDENDIPF
jgi:hypothetical protein